jgi:hypothetical protein
MHARTQPCVRKYVCMRAVCSWFSELASLYPHQDAASTPSHSSLDGNGWSDSSPMENRDRARDHTMVAVEGVGGGGGAGGGSKHMGTSVAEVGTRRDTGGGSSSSGREGDVPESFESRFVGALRASLAAAQRQADLIETELEMLSLRHGGECC